jgi:hypothetical protein
MSIKQKIKFKPIIVGMDLNAEDWNLYSNKPHAESVATNLNNTFIACVNQGYDKHQTVVKMTHIMNINRSLGANDSEPRRVLDELLEAVFLTER